MNDSSREKSLKRFSIPKVIYDIAVIAFLLPSFLYLHAYVYKLGKFDFYDIPSDYVEVGYNDILALWSVPLIFLLILLLPLYTFFLPQKVLEGLFRTKEEKPDSSDRKSGRFLVVTEIVIFLALGIASFVILANLKPYIKFIASVHALIIAIMFSVLMFGVQAFWNTRHSSYQKLLKSGSVIFAILMLLLSTTGIAREMGEFHAKKKTDYETVCAPEKNWVRIAKSGEQIVAKEIDPVLKKAGKKTLIIGSNCNDIISFEDISFQPAE